MSDSNYEVVYRPNDEPVVVSLHVLRNIYKNLKEPDLAQLYLFLLYTAKWQKTNSAYASTKFIAKALKWGKEKVIKNKRRLEEMGYIKPIVRRDAETQQITGHYLQVNWVWSARQTNISHIPSSQRVEKPEGGFQNPNAYNINKNTNNIKENTFEEFWKDYPLKKGKTGAKKHFDRLVKQGRLEDIMKALQNYNEYIKTNIIDKKYIKVCYNWFGQGVWEDFLALKTNVFNQSAPPEVDVSTNDMVW